MILVTGGSGYVGSVVVRKLLEKGYRVRVLDAGYFGHGSLVPIKDKIEFLEGDIRTVSADVFRGVDGVIHLAGFSNDPTAEYRPKENFSVNVDGTKRVVSLAKAADVSRFVFASSCSVYYTTNPDDVEKTEHHEIHPTVPYSLSKHMAEDVVLGAGDVTFRPVVFRKGTVYGLSPRMRYDLVVNTLLKDAYLNKKILLHQGGRMWRPLLDVQNAAEAYCYALEHNDVRGIYNVVDTNILVCDLGDRVQDILHKTHGTDIAVEKIDVGVSRSYRVSGKKFFAHGFRPVRSFEEAVHEMWNDLSVRRDVSHDKYYNIRTFEKLFS